MSDLPALTVASKAEAGRITTVFGGSDGYLGWLASALRDELERRAVREADEAANVVKRDAIEARLAEAASVVALADTARDVETVEAVALDAPVEAPAVKRV